MRDISDTLSQFYNLSISHETIRSWILKFSKLMNAYTNKFQPKTSGVWNCDEQMVKTKDKDFIYNWNVLDNGTKFLLATHSSRTRKIKDAVTMFKEAVKQNKKVPHCVITDRNPSYGEGTRIVFRKKNATKQVQHISIVGKRKIVNNNAVENYHTHFREFDKVRRGMQNVQDYSNGYKTFHNFIRQGIKDKKTPAERAGINVTKATPNRWNRLLNRSLQNGNQ